MPWVTRRELNSLTDLLAAMERLIESQAKSIEVWKGALSELSIECVNLDLVVGIEELCRRYEESGSSLTLREWQLENPEFIDSAMDHSARMAQFKKEIEDL